MIRINGRNTIGKPDKLFGVSALAKARIAEIGKENVINSTLGVLLDDNGKLVVLSSVMEALHELRPEEFAAYAPIIGIPEYKEAVTKAVFWMKSRRTSLSKPATHRTVPAHCATRSPATAARETRSSPRTGIGHRTT